MSTAQQLGLVGNSVRVQALPTASAETFGQGNRYYTLIGQQEGYITGHTYHTIVANDVYSWEDVAGGNYNVLTNIPVINQDLSASGFTPVANTYYRHTGATSDTFTQGIIYLYDTAYHKLGESGGGKTLNKYTAFIGDDTAALTTEQLTLISKILLNAKGNTRIIATGILEGRTGADWTVNYSIYPFSPNPDILYFTATCYMSYFKKTYNWYFWIQNNAIRYDVGKCIAISNENGTISFIDKNNNTLRRVTIVYYNDTEIT